MAGVELVKISKTFGKQQAVKELSLQVADGSFVCLLGPSGCGKTTTLRMIAGLEKPDSGDIYIDGVKVNDMPPHRRDIAMVFQFYAIYPGLTVFENLAFPLKQRKWSKTDIQRRVKEVAEMLQLENLLDKDAMSLTVGEKQRIALGRALVRNPKVFLYDEPLTNLDARLRAKMRVQLKKLHQQIKTTTIYVTHDQLEAMTLADKIGVMNFGVLQQFDTPENLYNSPANVFVAGFIGSPTMNLVECVAGKRDGKTTLEFGDFTVAGEPWEKRFEGLHEGMELVMGVRPTDLWLDTPSEGALVRGVVDVIEPLGDKSIIDVSVGRIIFRVMTSKSTRINLGDQVGVYSEPEKIHLFDRKTGMRL